MKKILLCLVVFLGVFALVGCGKNIAGKYELYEAKSGETVFNADQIKSLGIKYTLDVKSNGKATMDLAGEKMNMTYDDKYFTYKGEKQKYTYKNGKITFAANGVEMTFKKTK